MLYLCSSSKSRALLLDKFRIPYIQKSPSFDEEQIVAVEAKSFAYLASKGKLESSIIEFGTQQPLLCADSVIATFDGKILRKPKDIEDAREILLEQSGSEISIISSLHYWTKKYLFTDITATHYHFASFDRDELEAYLATYLWRGKAGGCMVEGFCKKYILKVTGYESTAMGLQVEKLLPWL